MKRALLILLAACLIMAALSSAALAADDAVESDSLLNGFSDLAGVETYRDDICFCLTNGIMNGVAAGLFDPDGLATRGMAVTMLYRLAGEPAFMNDNTYTDVARGSWYEKPIVWASGKAIIPSLDGKFSPDSPITREELATLLYNYAKYKEYDVSVGENTNILSYDDIFDTDEWAMAALQWSCGSGVLNGEDALLRPFGTLTRAETAAVFHRFNDNAVSAEPSDPMGAIAGGWTLNPDFAEPDMPQEARAAFDQAMEGFLGVGYTPVAYLGSQVVAGRNYAYLCKATVITAQPVTKLAVVKVYCDLQGNASILDIADIGPDNFVTEPQDSNVPLCGGWTISTEGRAALPENVQTAFDTAVADLLGKSYTPLAFLASQVVAGRNYAVLCANKPVVPNATVSLELVVVYAALDGSARITQVAAVTF